MAATWSMSRVLDHSQSWQRPDITWSPRTSHLGNAERGTARILPVAQTAMCLDLFHRRHGLIGRAAT